MAELRRLGLRTIVEQMDGARHLLVLTWNEARRRLIAAGQVAVWNGKGQPVAVLVPSWKEARAVRRILMQQFGGWQKVGGGPVWQPLEELRGSDVLVVTYERFVNYLMHQPRCGFYRLVLHEVDQLVQSPRMVVLEALLERVVHLRQGFRVCCTAGRLPRAWLGWFQERFPCAVVIRNDNVECGSRISVVECGMRSLEEVVPGDAGRACVVVPREACQEVAREMELERPEVRVMAYGEMSDFEGFGWVGVDVRHDWPSPWEIELVMKLVAPGGRLELFFAYDEHAEPEEIRDRFLANALSSASARRAIAVEYTSDGIAQSQRVLELVLQLMRKVRYVRELPSVLESLFLFSVGGALFLTECEIALKRLEQLGLVVRPRYMSSSGRLVASGWVKTTKEGQRLASDFTRLDASKELTEIENLSELISYLTEEEGELSQSHLSALERWLRGKKPPHPPSLILGQREPLARFWRRMKFLAKVIGLSHREEWNEIDKWLRLPLQRSSPEVTDPQAVARLARRLCYHFVAEHDVVLSIDVESWHIVDPWEMAELEGLEVAQVKRLLFRFFVDITQTRLATLEHWAQQHRVPRETPAQVAAVAARLTRGHLRIGIGRPRTVLWRCEEGG